MKVKIIDQDIYGDGVAKVDSMPIFVNNALPDEEVEIIITQEKKNYKKANVKSILKESKKRVEPLCPFYTDCGGCNLLHQEYKAQLQFKKNKVLNNLHKIAGLKDVEINEVISGDQYNYRNKVTLHVKNNKLGFYKKGSNDIIKINNCLLANEKINTIIKLFDKLNLNNLKEVTIRISEYDNKSMVLLNYNKNINDLINELIKTNQIDTIIISKDNKYKTVYNDGFITEKIGDHLFNISAQSFFQVNTKLAQKLYEEISCHLENNKKSTVLDLYCGTGSMGISVASKVKKVIGIEQEKSAIENAITNKEMNNIKNIEFILGTVEDNIDKIKTADVIIMDPPRSGCDTKTLDNILKLNPSKIIYVSCDSATLARDIKYMDKKYEVMDFKIIDMFSNTYHIEALVLLKQKII